MSNETPMIGNHENTLLAGSSPAMRTTFTREIDSFKTSDINLTQNPPKSGEDEVSKCPVKLVHWTGPGMDEDGSSADFAPSDLLRAIEPRAVSIAAISRNRNKME